MKGVQSILHSQLLISLAIFFGAIIDNGLVYGLLRGLARNLANKNRIENPRGFS